MIWQKTPRRQPTRFTPPTLHVSSEDEVVVMGPALEIKESSGNFKAKSKFDRPRRGAENGIYNLYSFVSGGRNTLHCCVVIHMNHTIVRPPILWSFSCQLLSYRTLINTLAVITSIVHQSYKAFVWPHKARARRSVKLGEGPLLTTRFRRSEASQIFCKVRSLLFMSHR